MSNTHSDIGLIGLAVMGQNLALNVADHGFSITVYNRTTATTERFVADNPSTLGALHGEATLEGFVKSLRLPRKIIILVKAGPATDAVIDSLVPLLTTGDVVVDGGNAHWLDTIRREKALAEKGLRFIGSGVSGGEEGARFGPSLMPGGTLEAYEEIRPIWEAIAAKVDERTGKPIEGAAPDNPTQGGTACSAYTGPNGAGHYVKMVHNGIEYGDMQMISESYALMRDLLGMESVEIGDVFSEWNLGVLDSFLVEITADILRQLDPVTGKPLIDIILDAAGQKGTGKWTSISALDLAVPAPTVAEAVFARFLSAAKDERVAAAKSLRGPAEKFGGNRADFIESIHDALYCSKICAYAQGFQLMRQAQHEYGWELPFSNIARIWRGGCIIRAQFLQNIATAFERDPALVNLLLDPYFQEEVERCQDRWRRVIGAAVHHGIATPTFSSALAYFDAYRSERLPASLLQAQRDYFGAHSYERVDSPRGAFFHLDWMNPDRPQREA